MYCLCVNVYCHRVSTQLHLTNISISISLHPFLLRYNILTLNWIFTFKCLEQSVVCILYELSYSSAAHYLLLHTTFLSTSNLSYIIGL
jgi:hypothetical protein